jgi:recombination protein RecT
MANDTKPAAEQKREHPLVTLRRQAEERGGEFQAALPAHIPVERFVRVLLTAVQNNPDLVNADRASFWNAAMRSAQDGLLPDGREGAIVIYRTKKKVKDPQTGESRDVWLNAAQWMPMIFGVLKKIRNSGEIAVITARIVCEGDHYRNWIDSDGEHIEYEQGDGRDPNKIRKVFAMAKTKTGDLYVEEMTPADIEKVRAVSRAKDSGPWVQWWDQMALKTVLRRLAKRLPMSTDLDDLIRRDDDLYDMQSVGDSRVKALPPGGRPPLNERLGAVAGAPSRELPPPAGDAFNPETGEIQDEPEKVPAGRQEPPAAKSQESRKASEPSRQEKPASEPEQPQDDDDTFPGDRPSPSAGGVASDFIAETERDVSAEDERDPPDAADLEEIAYQRGREARRRKMSDKALPAEYKAAGKDEERRAWHAGYEDEKRAEGATNG